MRAVILDFYGTLGESQWSDGWMAELLAEHGYALDPEVSARWAIDALDGIVHDEASQSSEHYAEWQRSLYRSMLRDTGAPEELVGELEARLADFTIEPYPETHEVLDELRRRGLLLAVCSNWSWDLDHHLETAGVLDRVDVRVASAWVGARKPHPRIYEHTLAETGMRADEVLFVGDSWEPDVAGPTRMGMRAVHVDRGAVSSNERTIADLRGLLDLV